MCRNTSHDACVILCAWPLSSKDHRALSSCRCFVLFRDLKSLAAICQLYSCRSQKHYTDIRVSITSRKEASVHRSHATEVPLSTCQRQSIQTLLSQPSGHPRLGADFLSHPCSFLPILELPSHLSSLLRAESVVKTRNGVEGDSKNRKEGLGVWLSWRGVCLACTKLWVLSPTPKKAYGWDPSAQEVVTGEPGIQGIPWLPGKVSASEGYLRNK